VSVLSGAACPSPIDFFERWGDRGPWRGGGVLMESAAQGAPAGTRSLVIPASDLRLVARADRALFSPLSTRARPLLDALAHRLPEARREGDGLAARFPPGLQDPSRPDEERLTLPSVLDALRILAGLVEDEDREGSPPIPPPGVYGAFSYEIVDRWENLPPRRPSVLDENEPDLSFVYALDAIVFDHLRGEVRVVTRSLGQEGDSEAERRHRAYLDAMREASGGRYPPSLFAQVEPAAEADLEEEAFFSSVEKFLSHIRAGDIFQGVLSRGFRIKSPAPPLAVYRVLRERNPSPYMFYLDLGDGVLLGASPETCLKVEGREIEIRPIAGTAPRGLRPDGSLDPDRDARLAVSLLLDGKEQAEHAMLLDLARNDVARVSVPGSRRVLDPFAIEKYSHVQHLVSRVRGELLPGLDALHAYRASANMGTLTGAPKLRAMELIRETEPGSRGFYGGAVGYLLQDGSFDTCIVIRSLRWRSGVYTTRAGAGIVAESRPERELAETVHKSRACLEAVALAEGVTS
jgi:anthranilate synthase component 1